MTSAALGSVAEFINGFAFKPSDWDGTGLPIIRIQNLTDKTKPYNRTTRVVASKHIVHLGELLVSWSATLGVFTWDQPQPGLVNQHIFKVIPDERIVTRDYLRHMLAGAVVAMERHLHGATMQHVNRAEFLGTRIPLPPLDDQRRIAAILDRAEALRTTRRQTLVHLSDLTHSIFLDMFGNPDDAVRAGNYLPLSDIVETLQGGKNLVAADPDLVARNRVLKISAVTSFHYRPTESKPLPNEYTPPAEHFVRTGDLLISRANTTELVGAVALVESTPSNLVLPDKLWRFVWRDPDAVEPIYVWALLQTPAMRRELSARSSGTGGSMKNISKAKLGALPVPWPSHAEQRGFALRLKALGAIRTRIDDAKLDKLCESLQSSAFSG